MHACLKFGKLVLSVAKAVGYVKAGLSRSELILTKHDIYRQAHWTTNSRCVSWSQLHFEW